jgi:hypothetical protein
MQIKLTKISVNTDTDMKIKMVKFLENITDRMLANKGKTGAIA